MKVIYHHNDMDGRAAASLIYNVLNDENEKFIIKELDYVKPIDTSIAKDQNVYILDYSFTENTKDQLIDIFNKAKSVVWIDHHISSKYFMKKHSKDKIFNRKINKKKIDIIIIDTTRCGAMITYDYLIENTGKKLDSTYHPRSLELIDDFDRWANKYKDSMYFKLGMDCQSKNPTSKIWYEIIMSKITDNLIKEGKIIYKYLKSNNLDEFNQVSYYLDHIPNDMDSNVKRILVINTNYNNNSLAFGNKLTKNVLGVIWTFDGKYYRYSIYSSPDSMIDCNAIALKYGGGGHNHASGFSSEERIF